MDQKILDFDTSFFKWETHQKSHGRFPIEAICIIKHGSTSEKFYLLKEVIACDVYGTNTLIYYPSFFFQAIFSTSEYKIFRTHTPYKENQNSRGPVTERFTKVIPIEREILTKVCSTFQDIQNAYEQNLRFYTIVESSVKNLPYEYILIFPVRNINIQIEDQKYQIETGPVLFPMIKHDRIFTIDDFFISHIAFNSDNTLDYIPNKPKRLCFSKKIATFDDPKTAKGIKIKLLAS